MSQRANSEQVRHAYVSLIQDIQDSREELIDPSNNSLSDCFQRANELYKNVHSAREQALDSQTLALISHTAVDKLERFRTDFKDKHEPIQFVQRLPNWLKSDGSSDAEDNADDDDDFGATQPIANRGGVQLNWHELGKRVTPYFNQTPSCDFLYGLLDVPQKEKRKINRQPKEKVVPIVVAKEGIDDANQVGKETTKYVEQIYKVVKKEKQKPLYDTLINPQDFGQTVENFFYLSFLVKDGHVRISSDGNSEPMLELAEQPSKDDYAQGKADKKQCVVKLDYNMWQKLSEQKNLEEPFLPHRDYSTFLKAAEDRRKRVVSQLKDSRRRQSSSQASEDDDQEDGEEEEEEETQPTPRASGKRKQSSRTTTSDGEDAPQRKKRKSRR